MVGGVPCLPSPAAWDPSHFRGNASRILVINSGAVVGLLGCWGLRYCRETIDSLCICDFSWIFDVIFYHFGC